MARNLVIVESPAKANTIEKYLGKDFQVLASMGHIRDLPASKLGVAVEEAFAPHYITPQKSKATLKKLKEALKGKEVVYLATDLDREGEAIAWHIAEALELSKLPNVTTHRITFDEITKDAITRAVAHPRTVDMQLVDAQQARRVLDRLVGYTLSPVLWKKLYRGLSAGRVQSVALRLVVDREAERDAFIVQHYWSIDAEFSAQGEVFKAALIEWKGKKLEDKELTDEAVVAQMVQTFQQAPAVVADVTEKTVQRKPAAPYTTSSFQQDAVNKLGLTAKRAMRIAQTLYEAGHITYMRTDSVDLAAEAVEAIRTYIGTEFGAPYVPASAPRYTGKSARAQEAHEAIRPTNIAQHPSSVSEDPAVIKVYSLIRSRALASQMAPASLLQRAARINVAEGVFKATGQTVVFPGFLAAWQTRDEEDQNTSLPALKKNDSVEVVSIQESAHATEPPPRYSEATLIKALEEHGIGRPSTYAPTIDTLVERRYVRIEQRRLVPESIGTVVTTMLKEHFANIVDAGFTADMEDKLDQVAEGKQQYADILGAFWEPFHAQVEEKIVSIPKVDLTEATSEICPTCGASMVIRQGRFGAFLACSKFPDCKTTAPLQQKAATGLLCPIDGKPLVQRRGKRGLFFGCSGYPDCTFAVWKREQFPTKVAELKEAGTELPFEREALEAFATLPAQAE
jgi:DNA topoisomerase-1